MIKKIYDPSCASACFFRSTVQRPQMKVMLQITERCNLKCAHCFAESNCCGGEMDFQSIKDVIVPQFIRNNVVKVTLTGGEPLMHPQAKDIAILFLENGIGVSICTNGTLIDPAWVKQLSQYDNVHFNVSLDGLTLQSHGRFRGITSEPMLSKIKQNICMLGEVGLLNGILTTPNKYATIKEYIALCEYARNVGACYVLMNPLSPFGRGTKTQELAYSTEEMIALREQTAPLITEDFEVVYIRFPNSENRPIGGCPLGAVPYVFWNGDITACPYMVFAAGESALYNERDFIVGNIFEGADIATQVRNFDIKRLAGSGGKDAETGCYAIKISKNQHLSDDDYGMYPVNGE